MRVTMPTGRPCSDTISACDVAGQQLDRLAHRVDGGDARERRLHHVADRRAITAGSLIAAFSSPRSPTEPDDRVRIVGADHRQLRDAVLVQQRDRVAHGLVRLDDDERRDLPRARLLSQHVADRAVARRAPGSRTASSTRR